MQLFKFLLSFCLLTLAYAQSLVGSSGSGDTGSTDTGGSNDAVSSSSSGITTMAAATSKVTSAASQATNKPSSGAAGFLSPDWKVVGSLAAICVGGVMPA